MLGILERLERADRAMERKLLVSESRGAEVGPLFLGVVPLGVELGAIVESGWP